MVRFGKEYSSDISIDKLCDIQHKQLSSRAER